MARAQPTIGAKELLAMRNRRVTGKDLVKKIDLCVVSNAHETCTYLEVDRDGTLFICSCACHLQTDALMH